MRSNACARLVCSTALAVAACAGTARPQPGAEKTAGRWDDVTRRGWALAQYDAAAWHASDALVALRPDRATLRRYVARKSDGRWQVAFGRVEGDRFRIAYLARETQPPMHFEVTKEDPPLDDRSFFYLAAKAIETALADFQGQDRPYNAALLAADDGRFHVYFVPAQTVPDRYPYGGDARYLISADGAAILEKRQLHRAILEFGPAESRDKELAAGYHVHVLSEVPEDTDVFYVLTRKPRVPEYVGAKEHVYEIDVVGHIVEIQSQR